MSTRIVDPVLWNDWHVVADVSDPQGPAQTPTLLGVPLRVHPSGVGGGAQIERLDRASVRSATRYGFAWACLGTPARALVDIVEAREPDRLTVTGGSIAVRAASPRVVENFLDMGHFPFVHDGFLGAEPQTEVRPYRVEPLPGGGLVARDCRFHQPVASVVSQSASLVDYTYRVLRPLTVMLEKSSPSDPQRPDLIYLFVQPVGEETSVAHLLTVYLQAGVDATQLRHFGQLIFSQDISILQNQIPKRLPLAPRAELAIRADQASVAYRRWLSELGLTYGVIPAEAA